MADSIKLEGLGFYCPACSRNYLVNSTGYCDICSQKLAPYQGGGDPSGSRGPSKSAEDVDIEGVLRMGDLE